LYFAIKEEEDEEDSFEKEKKSRRERQRLEFERKMDMVESLVVEKIPRDARTFVAGRLESFDEVLSRESDSGVQGSRILIGDEDLLAPFEGIGKTISILERQYSSEAPVLG